MKKNKCQPDNRTRDYIVSLFNNNRFNESEVLAREIISIFPKSSFGWEILGPSLEKLRKYKEANKAYLHALELAPDSEMTNTNYAVFLNGQHCYHDSLLYSKQATKLNPKNEVAWLAKGFALQGLMRLQEAKAVYERAIAQIPNSAKIINNLGISVKCEGREEEAVKLFRLAVRLSPDNAVFYYNLGISLIELGDVSEAAFCLAESNKIDPSNVLAYVGRARISIDQGNFSTAQSIIENALRVSPDSAAIWALVPCLRKMLTVDSSWYQKATEILDKKSIKKGERIDLLFATAKYLDDTRDYDKAFDFYRIANEEKKENIFYDKNNEARRVGFLVKTFNNYVITKAWPGASKSVRPVFIVGMPRSGTSLLEQMIASHSQIVGAGELRFWGQAVLTSMHEVNSAKFSKKLIMDTAADCLKNLDKYSTSALRVLDKMPANFYHLGFIHAVFPNARIIHAVRNPVDTCLSIFFQNLKESHDYANDLEDLAHYYREYWRLMKHWQSVLPKNVFMEVPYESLINQPESWCKRITKFIGLEWEEGCLSYYKTMRRVGTSSNWQVRQPIYKTSCERWRNYEKHIGSLIPLLELIKSTAGEE